jgi:hypothetical protein
MTQGTLDGPEVVYVNPDGTTDDEDAPSEVKKGGRGRIESAPEKKSEWSAELIERARAAQIEEEAIAEGGDLREGLNGNIYWLDLNHLVEFEEQDQAIDSDREFWAWFKAYRDKHNISARRSRVRWEDWGGSSKTSTSLGSWWFGNSYSAGSDLEKRLAIAVRAVGSIVNVINDTGHRFRVSLADKDSRTQPHSATYFDQKAVIVSPQALLDTSVNEDQGIDITAGWGLHEGSHIRFTSSVLDALLKPEQLKPFAVSSILFNILEDVRIEAKTSEDFPGFATYFEQANTYLWGVQKDHVPKKWEKTDLVNKLNVITMAMKWPVQYEATVNKATDQKLKEEYAWFRRLADRYKTERKDLRTYLVEAMLHLELDPETKQQMEQQAKDEEANGGGTAESMTNEQFEEFLKDLQEQLGKGLIQPCPSPTNQPGGATEQTVQLTAEQSAQVEKLVNEQYSVDRIYTKFPDSSGYTPEVEVSKPETTSSTGIFYRKPGQWVNKLKSAFIFRKVAPAYQERLQRTGRLDEEEIWRLAGNDVKIFEREIRHVTPDTQVTMLVDISGSMSGVIGGESKVNIAQNLASTMLECLKTMKGVRVRVRAHQSSGYSPNKGNFNATAAVYRIWEQGDPLTRLGLITEKHGSGNYDAFAIDWCANELFKNQRPGEDMILIVLSDGLPNGYGLSGISGEQMVREVVNTWKRKNVTIIQIAIDQTLRPKDQAAMFDNWMQFDGVEKLPQRLTKLLIKLFGGSAT